MANGNFKTVYKEKSLIVEFDSLSKLGDIKLIDFVKLEGKSIENFVAKRNTIKKKILFFDHHLCHAASSVISSNFNNTDYATIDGFGDFVSTTIGEFKNNKFYQSDEVKFPHSIGIFLYRNYSISRIS